jgi:hypothetical protein
MWQQGQQATLLNTHMKTKQQVNAHETRKEAGARNRRIQSRVFTQKVVLIHEAGACLPSPGVGGVHGGSALLGPAAADAEGVVLGRGRGRKREHFKGVVFMIESYENSLFWSRAAAGRQAPPAACDSLRPLNRRRAAARSRVVLHRNNKSTRACCVRLSVRLSLNRKAFVFILSLFLGP